MVSNARSTRQRLLRLIGVALHCVLRNGSEHENAKYTITRFLIFPLSWLILPDVAIWWNSHWCGQLHKLSVCFLVRLTTMSSFQGLALKCGLCSTTYYSRPAETLLRPLKQLSTFYQSTTAFLYKWMDGGCMDVKRAMIGVCGTLRSVNESMDRGD